MTFEFVGAAAILAGLSSLLLGRGFAIHAFLACTLLGASAAFVLTALGSATIQPAHVLLGFLLLVAYRATGGAILLRAVKPPSAGFFLGLTVLYGVASAFFLPRLLEGTTDVFAIARSETVSTILLTPVRPVSGNITQTAYLVGNLLCFIIFHALSSDKAGKRCVVDALIACGVLNLAFAIVDQVTFVTGTAAYLGFIRNSTYSLLDATETAGIKRIVGSFTEASAFAWASLSLFAFSLSLWLGGYRPAITLPLAVALLIAIGLSTSTTGYVGASIYLSCLLLSNLVRLLSGTASPRRLLFLICMPALIGTAAMAAALDDETWRYLSRLADEVIFNKSASRSGIERASWNIQAWTNFVESHGLGIGVGSTRASSFPLAALATIGIFGASCYAIAVALCLLAGGRDQDPESRAIRAAASSACFATMVSACLSGTTIDLGLVFFAYAGTAASSIRVPLAVREIDRGRARTQGLPWPASAVPIT